MVINLMSNPAFPKLFAILVIFILVAAIWELIWKGIGLWKCGRTNQPIWFIFILNFNINKTLNFYYIIYIHDSIIYKISI